MQFKLIKDIYNVTKEFKSIFFSINQKIQKKNCFHKTIKLHIALLFEQINAALVIFVFLVPPCKTL